MAIRIAGGLIAVGMMALYVHLQKPYEGVRPIMLQAGCSIPAAGGLLLAVYGG